jgi:hypothetical protein
MMKKRILVFLAILLSILIAPFVSASYSVTSTTYQGAFYGQEGVFPCDENNCWVHDCAWFSSRIYVAEAGTYTLRMNLLRDGSEQLKENIRVEANGKFDYHLDDGSYSGYQEFGPFYFYKGYNIVKFSGTRYGDFYYIGDENKCYYGSVHFSKFTLEGCPDTDNDGICDYYDYCIGENQNNLPPDTVCRNWFVNEVGCHDFTNKEYGHIIRKIDCDYLDTYCKDYQDTADICDGSGNILYGECGDYENEPQGVTCGTSYYEYACSGNNIYRKLHEFRCDGYGACKQGTGSWKLYQECDENEYCYDSLTGIVECRVFDIENSCPVLDTINDVAVTENDFVDIDASAVDIDGNNLTFYYSEPLDENGEWQTAEGDAGNYTVIITVTDGHCEDVETFNLEVYKEPQEPEEPEEPQEPEKSLCFPNIGNYGIDIDYVDVNDIDVYSEDDKITIERGDDIFIKVRFESEKNISELQIEAFIDIDDVYDEEFDIIKTTEWFNVVNGSTYVKEIILNVPDDLIKGDYPVKIKFYDKNGLMDTCYYEFKVTLPLYAIMIKDIQLTPQIVKAGRVIIGDVEVKNIGNATIENIEVKLSAPELNIMDSEIIKELGPRETEIVKDLILRIPACLNHQDYYAKAVAEYDYEKVSKVKLFEVLEGEGCSEFVDDREELKVIPKAENFEQGGTELPYTLILNNPTEKSKTYILTADGIDAFGNYRFEPSNVLVIPAKKSQVAYLYVSADYSDVIGARPVVITAKSDNELREDVTANIIKGKETCWICSFWSRLRGSIWYPILLFMIIVVIFLFFVLFILRRDEDDKK